MTKKWLLKVSLMDLPTFVDDRGYLTVWDKNVPFNIKRVFWIYGVPEGQSRANHYLRCHQFLIALKGSFEVNGQRLDNPTKGLYISKGSYIKLDSFSPDAICLVMCSESY